MSADRAKLASFLVLTVFVGVAFAFWWMLKPWLESFLSRVPGTAGVLAVGLGLWAILGFFLIIAYLGALAVAIRLTSNRT